NLFRLLNLINPIPMLSSASCLIEPTNLRLPQLESITNNFSDDMKIGTGGFAVVYKGLLQNGTVAVKKLNQTLDVDDAKFQKEVDNMLRVKHTNIVRFLGYCSDTHGIVHKLDGRTVMAEERHRFLCFEFLPEGSLDKYISDAAQGLEWMTRYQIIKGVCEGLHYLHQQNIVHLDLKPANILLDHYMVPKIADFGLSRCFDENQTRTTTSHVLGTRGYIAPESYGGLITLKSDIYSLGMIIIEILTGHKGYPDIDNIHESWSARLETLLGDIRLGPIQVCTEIGIECSDSNPAKRPDMQRIIERLAELECEYSFMKSELLTSATNPDDKVKLEIMGRVKSIPSTTSVEDFPVLVRVTAPLRYRESSRIGLDLVAVLGVSADMALENRMDSMKQAMMFVIDNLGPDDRLAIVSFDDEPQHLTDLRVMNDVNRAIAKQVVRILRAGGGVNMGLALNEAAKILRDRTPEKRSNRVGRIIFLSDSEDESGDFLNISHEFPAETFGLSDDHDPNDLFDIAMKTKGLYSYVTDNPFFLRDHIMKAFAQSLGGLISITAMDMQVNLRTLNGVTITSIESGIYPVSMSSDKQTGTIQVRDLYAGEQKNFIVYLKVPEGEQKQFMTVSGSYRNPKISKEPTIQLDDTELAVTLRPEVATTPSERTVCPDVAAELIRSWLMKHIRAIIDEEITIEELQRSWVEVKGSEDGRSASQSAVSALDQDVAKMLHAKRTAFIRSWLSSHMLQRATTEEPPTKSSALRVKAMEEIIKNMEAEQKRLRSDDKKPVLYSSTGTRSAKQMAKEEGGAGVEAGRRRGKLVHFEGQLAVTKVEIMGKSAYGTMMYKAMLADDSLVTVKWLGEVSKNFSGVVTAMLDNRFRHPNVLTLRRYYLGPMEQKLLIFDYMPNGSLSAFLHGWSGRKEMDWPTRMMIAQGMARGLAYLHHDKFITHGNLTASNILLDEQCNPKIVDFGLFRLMTDDAKSNVMAAAGTLGYLAPELEKLEMANCKTDMYSLGIILLELVTGKSPADRTSGMDLPQWVASIIKKEWTSDVFDRKLMQDAAAGTIWGELVHTLKLALQCVDPSPSVRPDAREVLRQLEQGSKLVHFVEPLACTANDLLCMPMNIIGRSWNGTVYQVSLKDGSVMTIKWLMRENIKGHNEFEAEVEVLGKIRHPNLLPLRAYYMGPNRCKMLVLDYMPKGSLSVFLHDAIDSGRAPNTLMDWATRMTIAKGTARGLAYLHDDLSIIHVYLTAGSVILDKGSYPTIADFEVSRLMTADAKSIALADLGKLGYRAPELSKVEEANEKTDVYNLGIIILELLTGKCPMNSTDGMDLPQWVVSIIKEERTSEVFDRKLMRDAAAGAVWDKLIDTLNLALQCVDSSPSVRPKAREVLQQLEQIWKLVHFVEPLACTADDLLYAPRKILYHSWNGTVYQVSLKDGSVMTIKWLMRENTKGHNEFKAEVEVLGKIRHPNLMALRAYYMGPNGSRMLVLDYKLKDKGSLFRYLRGGLIMDWATRMTIAKGTARGLTYLHDDMSIIHVYLISGSVILDEGSYPKINDFEVSSLMTADAKSKALADLGKMGYRAPELSKVEEANEKTDVYSLGIIILELLTGRSSPMNSTDGMDLPQWVVSIIKEERTTEVFDRQLMRDAAAGTVRDELIETLNLALQCVDSSPSVRPKAREVLQQLEQISKMVHFVEPLACTADDLLYAPKKIIFTGWSVTVYKASLKDGSEMELKFLMRENIKGHNKFKAEAEVLGKIRHPNLRALRAYYMRPNGCKMLVLEYMPKGSLSAFTHGRAPNTPLDWLTRMTIAKGTARGLAYLHDEMSIIHVYLTARIIHLDEQLNPKIIDFEVSRLMTADVNSQLLVGVGKLGYSAPELSKVEEANTKTDVYSLGVIILELLTGKSPEVRTNGMDLPQWVECKVKEERTNEVFDLVLQYTATDIVNEELMDTLKLALQCVDPSPSVRPKAREVLRRLEQIRPGSDGGVGPSEEEDGAGAEAGRRGGKLVHFAGQLAFTKAEMMRKSTYGTMTYKVTLADNSLVAVKWLGEGTTKDPMNFRAVAASLLGNKIRHPNVLALRAYYLGPMGQKLLVFDYMPKGSLSAFLHGWSGRKKMDWPTRMMIAQGMARGLAYLHHDKFIIHGNLTASNILLDEQCNPKIVDFGLFRLMTDDAKSNVMAAAGTLGYLAPELEKLEMANPKTDMYSLGIILLELVTGKSPADRTNGMDLPQWVASIIKKEWTSDVFDRKLMQDAAAGTVWGELVHMLKLALQCVDPSPSVRPDAREVLRQLEQESKLVHFVEPLACTANDLLCMPMNMIGRSWNGTVYQVSLKDGSVMTIKWLIRENIKGHNEFEAEVEVLGKIRHPNLLLLRAYYMGPSRCKMLILDYMPKGSLSVFLHDAIDSGRAPNTLMDWAARMMIAKGTARGLAYLHDSMSIIHVYLTAGSVILGEGSCPKIADFEVSSLMTADACSNMLAELGKMGYRAPELSKVEEANEKTDVYSLGIIILELLTGRSPMNNTDGMNLPQWVASIIKEETTSEVFDRKLTRDAAAGTVRDELIDTLNLALQCVDSSPSVRPKAREVLQQLEQIWKLVHFVEPLACTAEDLLYARRKEIGNSWIGTLFKLSLKDGSEMAFKFLINENIKGHNEFKAEVEVLGKIRHPNLLALRAYYIGPNGCKFLVFQYLPKGSLSHILRGQIFSLVLFCTVQHS
ncbi:hypothetical protein EJB05_29360, partial [Eragrostis curvula]